MAKPGDAGALGALHCQAWRETYPGLLPAAMLQSLSPEKSAARFAQEGCRDMLLAFCGGEPAGFCGFGPWRAGSGAAEGEIIGLYVLKAYQRRGVGTALLRAALAALAARGLDRVSLWVLGRQRKGRASFTKVSASPPPARPKANRRCANAACGGKAKMTRAGVCGFPVWVNVCRGLSGWPKT